LSVVGIQGVERGGGQSVFASLELSLPVKVAESLGCVQDPAAWQRKSLAAEG